MTLLNEKERTSRSANRIDGIDVLRGLCILAVIFLHIDIRIPFTQSAVGAHIPRLAWSVLFRSGHYGVVVFFVISGFLITNLSLKRWGALDQIQPIQFYGMRFARIVPCLIALLSLLSLLDILGLKGFVIDPSRTTLGRALWSAATFHLNWLEAKVGDLPGSWDVLWSLSVEEAFYFGFPLVCRFVRNKSIIVGLMLSFVVIGPFARTIFAWNDIWSDYSYLSGMDGIALGCLAALVAADLRPGDRLRGRLAWLGGAAIFGVIVLKPLVRTLGLYRTGLDITLLEIASACLILGVQQGMPLTAWYWKPLKWYGKNSYEIYLTHSFVMVLGAQAFLAVGTMYRVIPLWHIAMTFVAGLLGYAVARSYSEPMNRNLRGWFRESSTEPALRRAQLSVE
jgi:peptidoglycan/LPS O-acetylase OafA/YrhL